MKNTRGLTQTIARSRRIHSNTLQDLGRQMSQFQSRGRAVLTGTLSYSARAKIGACGTCGICHNYTTICRMELSGFEWGTEYFFKRCNATARMPRVGGTLGRSEEHTSELQ